MGGLTTFAATAIQALNAANTIIGAIDSYKQSGREYDQRRKEYQYNLQKASENAAFEKERILLDAQATEAERRAALRRAMAKQRAKFGSSGTGSSGGSAQAVLLGMFDESDEELQQRNALDSLRLRAADTGVDQQARINTLQLTQLRERDRLKSINQALGSAKAIGSIF